MTIAAPRSQTAPRPSAALAALPTRADAAGDLEWSLILCTSAPRIVDASERIREAAGRGIDWDRVARLAEAHGVAGLVERSLAATCPEYVPNASLRRLHLARRATEIQNRFLAQALVRVVKRLAADGICVVPVKGPLLAEAVFGDMTLRSTRDLDFLIRREDVLRARDALLDSGMRLIKPQGWRGTQPYDFLRYHELTFAAAHEGVYVEIQWSIANDRFHSRLRIEDAWRRLTYRRFDGTLIPSLSREDLLILLCEHGTKHVWSRLKWTCDVAELTAASEFLDWEAVRERAGASGSERALHVGLLLSRDMLGVPLPGAIAHEVRADEDAAALAHYAMRRLVSGNGDRYGVFSWKKCLFHARSRETREDRLQHLDRFLRFIIAPKGAAGELRPSDFVLMPVRLPPRLVRSFLAERRSRRRGT